MARFCDGVSDHASCHYEDRQEYAPHFGSFVQRGGACVERRRSPRRVDRPVYKGRLVIAVSESDVTRRRVVVCDYGIGNLRSVVYGLSAAGINAELITTPEQAIGASAVILPGVGAFGSCADALRNSGFDQVVIQAQVLGVATLAICVGLQLLFEGSDESPAVEGLAILPGVVRELPSMVKKPQMQWNIVNDDGCIDRRDHQALRDSVGKNAWMYFVHSYAARPTNDTALVADYGVAFTAAIAKGNLWATQFHPEKSSLAGRRLLHGFGSLIDNAPATLVLQ